MKKLLFSFLLPLFTIWVSAQVPAGQDEAALPQPGAGANAQEESFVGSLFSDPSEIENIEGLDEPLERVRLRDQDTNLILDMIQTITGRYILRPQNLPQVKINFDSMSVLTRRETLLALESLLAMNGIGITKIDSQFFKAVPATGMNAHVPIWLDVPASSLPPSQRIYTKLFPLNYVSAEKMREILNPMCTPNVSSLIIFSQANSILITDSLLNLQRVEKIIRKVDKPNEEMRFEMFWYTSRRLSAGSIAKIFEAQWETVWKNHFDEKPHLILPSKINLSNPQKREISDADVIEEGNVTRVLSDTTVSSSSGGMADIPINKLGVTCRKLDKVKILDILTAIDLDPDDLDNFITFWYTPNRFTAQQLAQLFLDQWDIIWKNEFFMLPAFITTSAGDQLGVVCHKDDSYRIEKIFNELEVKPRHKIKQRLIPLYHASAETVWNTLDRLISTLRSNASEEELTGTLGGENNNSRISSSKNKRLSAISSYTFSKLAYSIPDARSNGIFAFGIERDLDLFTELISELDTPLPMARIDTIFVMVDLTHANQKGIDALFSDLKWKPQNSGEESVLDDGPDDKPGTEDDFYKTVPFKNDDEFSGNLKVPLLNTPLKIDMVDGKLRSLQWNQIFALASNREDVRIFSTPSITVSHGQGGGKSSGDEGGGDSYIEIKDERKVGLSGATNANGSVGSGDIKPLEARTRLDIIDPRIRKTVRDSRGNVIERGTIFMSVIVEASKFDQTTANTYEGQTLPTTKSRKASTDIAIRDGQIMALGGFREVQIDEEVSKYNFLSSIPYLGKKLFTPTQRSYTPTELMIFIRPTIIDPENPLDDYTDFNSRRIDSMMNKDYTPVFRSPSGKILGSSEKEIKYSEQDNRSTKPSL